MVGVEAMPAKEAQRVDNATLRDKQVSEGIAAAKEMGLGNWKVSRAGREFKRCDAND